MTAISRPKNLTAKEWRDNKGLFTKTVSDATGMGKALDKLDKAWNDVPWNKVDPDQAAAHLGPGDLDSTWTVANVNALKKEADQHSSKVKAVKTELLAVEALARQTGNSWKANKLVPSSSTKYVGQVQSAAKALLKQLDELDDAWQKELERAKMSQDMVQKRLNGYVVGYVGKLRSAVQAMQNTPSRDAYRTMAQTLKELVPYLSKSADRAHQELHERLAPLAADKYFPANDDAAKTQEAARRAQHVADALRGV